MALEGGFALEEPAGNPQQERGMIASQRERGVDEGVRLDQGAVKVDAKRREESRVESVDRKWAK